MGAKRGGIKEDYDGVLQDCHTSCSGAAGDVDHVKSARNEKGDDIESTTTLTVSLALRLNASSCFNLEQVI